MWKLQRKVGVRFFSASNLKTFIDEVWPRHLKKAENRLEAVAGGSKVVDLQEVFLELTTGLMGEMAYDVSSSGKGVAGENHKQSTTLGVTDHAG